MESDTQKLTIVLYNIVRNSSCLILKGYNGELKAVQAKDSAIYRVIQNDCRGFNNLSYTIRLR